MRVIIACAGTGGHINPGIAIAKTIQSNEKSEVLFIGTENGLENQLVANAGYDIKHIRTGKLYRKVTLKNIKSVINNIAGLGDAKKIIKEFKPDVVIGTGGYICGAVMLAAKANKIPYILHESNAFPGVAVKLLAKKAAKVLAGFEDTKGRLKNRENVVYVGSPAKFSIADFDKLDKKECLISTGLEELAQGRKIIFVTGGSQGAKKINEVVISLALEEKSKDFFIVIAVGNKNYDEIMKKLEAFPDSYKHIKVERFIFEMDKMYKASDLLITRAGAMTITELCLAGKASILIPFPYAAENHQLYNAKVLEKAGAATIIEESNFSKELLKENIKKLISDEKNDTLVSMGNKARNMAKLNVEDLIYNEIKEALK